MNVLDLHWLKNSINHNVATDDARAVRHDEQDAATYSKNMDQFCTFHQAPSHTIHNCNAAKATKNRETTSHEGELKILGLAGGLQQLSYPQMLTRSPSQRKLKGGEEREQQN